MRRTTTISDRVEAVGYSMEVLETAIPNIKLFKPVRHVDSRGFFSEVFKESELRERGIDIRFVQDNHSLSASKGVVRGLHFQIPPSAQAKLLRVTAGSIFDVAVDIRWGSPSFGHHVAAVLSVADWNQIFIPEGFAHGYCTLEPATEVIYKVSAYYSPEHDRGLLWNDPALGIAWPVLADQTLLSEKDRKHPVLSNLPRYFHHRPPSNLRG
jgi:dTDP-4-dehydrorhamnose 3,5-epimerase